MALQGPKGVNFEGRGVNTTAQVAGRAEGKAKVLAVTDATGNVILPVSSNGLPFAAYQITAIGDAAVYWKLGADNTVTVNHVSDACDDVLGGNASTVIANHEGRTYIAAITESGTATLVIAGIV